MRSCVSPEGHFTYGIHRPGFRVRNMRQNDHLMQLGLFQDGTPCSNHANFPEKDVVQPCADTIFEVSNAFSFRGATYINTRWADENAKDPAARIRLPKPPQVSFSSVLSAWNQGAPLSNREKRRLLAALPEPLKLALAETGTDPDDLVSLAHTACDFVLDQETGRPNGLAYTRKSDGCARPKIHNSALFDVLANNPCLPEIYREVMVLRPGVQGANEIVGEYTSAESSTHVYEYLRSNSYIPWGHYAVNMAQDAIRYSMADLSLSDMRGMRHLYYQRTYVRLARDLGISIHTGRRSLDENELENLRCCIQRKLADRKGRERLVFNRTLWGWNYGFDYAPTRYRLHASHQQIHQQYAMIPKTMAGPEDGKLCMASYAVGDLVEQFVDQYAHQTGVSFFDAYLAAIENNRRMEGTGDKEHSLIVHSDDNVLVFVPKAQTSQWELQVMVRPPVGNIVEADAAVRRRLDEAILMGAKALTSLGAEMIAFYESSRRMDMENNGQRLMYVLLPRLPESPGAFSESQLRWINGHYPEDFATACRAALAKGSDQ